MLLAGFGEGEGAAAAGGPAAGFGAVVGSAEAAVGDTAAAGETVAAAGDGGPGVRVGGMVIPPLLHAVSSIVSTVSSTRGNGNRPPSH
jgi:hypothetical protein